MELLLKNKRIEQNFNMYTMPFRILKISFLHEFGLTICPSIIQVGFF